MAEVSSGGASAGAGGGGATARGPLLLALARQAIAESLGLAAEVEGWETEAPWLRDPGATFVTLMRGGRLRGCVGSIRARRPLGEDVRANARAAAFGDPRFPPLAAAEWPETAVEVSLLTPPAPLAAAASEAAAAAALRPGIDGVVLEYREKGATFLPQVWKQLPEPRQFLAHLKRKAGLPRSFWSPEVRLLRYTVEKWTEGTAPDLGPEPSG
jgi:AmmeMemoRadiSam system protein A